MRRSRLPFKAPRFTLPKQEGEASSPSFQQHHDLKKRKLQVPVVPQTTPSDDDSVTKSEIPQGNIIKFNVQWRKRSTRKNKVWEGDGILTCESTGTDAFLLSLKDSEGKYKCKKSVTNTSLEKLKCDILVMGQLEVEIESSIVQENDSVEPEAKPRIFKPMSRNASYKDQSNALYSVLRPHQLEGVNFITECINGSKGFPGNGCLLADEMGLGKTLMTITVIMSLLQKNPRAKILIVCPLTIVNNWKNEFKKWVGNNSLASVLTLASGKNAMSDQQNMTNFAKLAVYNVLIINYEKITAFHKDLSKVNCELLVCDEGHRLKSSANKVLNCLASLPVMKRILITGTPIQNDLVEYFTIINFINPGILGDFKSFQKEYIGPILRSRDVNCFDAKIKKHGRQMTDKLIQITQQFTIRRTASVIPNYLTSKTDVILFARPTSLQVKLFNDIIGQLAVHKLMLESGDQNQALQAINMFRKLCNSPTLLNNDDYYQSLLENGLKSRSLTTSSGKINTLVPLLLEFGALKEKVVIVSNFTKTLDLLEQVAQKLNLRFSRLDGTTPAPMRQKIVNEFNNASYDDKSVFFLSSKSGGMGINLFGASRLVLFDNDWNPTVDLQSMARIHREGQKRDCFIYRILTTGCIDEKIFQRQLTKSNLSKKFLDNEASSTTNHFNDIDLKNIFEIDMNTNSNTHDLLQCECAQDGSLQVYDEAETDQDEEYDSLVVSASDLAAKIDDAESKSMKAGLQALRNYRHILPTEGVAHINDTVLKNIIQNANCPFTYIMTCEDLKD